MEQCILLLLFPFCLGMVSSSRTHPDPVTSLITSIVDDYDTCAWLVVPNLKVDFDFDLSKATSMVRIDADLDQDNAGRIANLLADQFCVIGLVTFEDYREDLMGVILRKTTIKSVFVFCLEGELCSLSTAETWSVLVHHRNRGKDASLAT